jgi:hypothetical protein
MADDKKIDGKTYDELLKKIKQNEKKSISNIIKYSIFSILGALLLIGFSIYQYTEVKSKLTIAKAELAESNLKLSSVRAELENENKLLRETLSISRYSYELTQMDQKNLYTHNQNASTILEEILQLRERNVGWKLGGADERTGFDSPNFALFVLKRLKIAPEGLINSPKVTSKDILDNLKPVIKPSVGDLVIYKSGFVMFYFTGFEGEKFVIGMTPSGISALKYNFGLTVGIRKVE